MEDIWRRMRHRASTDHDVKDDDGQDEIGGTVTVSHYSFIDYTLPMKPNRTHLQGFWTPSSSEEEEEEESSSLL